MTNLALELLSSVNIGVIAYFLYLLRCDKDIVCHGMRTISSYFLAICIFSFSLACMTADRIAKDRHLRSFSVSRTATLFSFLLSGSPYVAHCAGFSLALVLLFGNALVKRGAMDYYY